MSVVEATQRDLAVLARRAPELEGCALAAVALAMAEGIDAGNSLTSKSMAAKVLADTMAQLVALAPAIEEGDDLDELAARRHARLAGGSATPAATRS